VLLNEKPENFEKEISRIQKQNATLIEEREKIEIKTQKSEIYR